MKAGLSMAMRARMPASARPSTRCARKTPRQAAFTSSGVGSGGDLAGSGVGSGGDLARRQRQAAVPQPQALHSRLETLRPRPETLDPRP
jgi:hypothetical protein